MKNQCRMMTTDQKISPIFRIHSFGLNHGKTFLWLCLDWLTTKLVMEAEMKLGQLGDSEVSSLFQRDWIRFASNASWSTWHVWHLLYLWNGMSSLTRMPKSFRGNVSLFEIKKNTTSIYSSWRSRFPCI